MGPRRGGPEGWGPEGWGSEGEGAQNFALFFPSPAFSWNFGGVLKRRGPEMCTFGLSGCRVKPRQGPGLQDTTKIQRKDPQERKKELKIVAGEGKKSEILGGPAEGRSGGRGSGGGGRRTVGRSAQILDAPTKILNTHPTDTPHNTHHTPYTQHNTQQNTQHNTQKYVWPKPL